MADLDAENFPALPAMPPVTLPTPASSLQRMMKRTFYAAYAACDVESRMAIKCMHFEIRPGALRMAGTDGSRLAPIEIGGGTQLQRAGRRQTWSERTTA